MQTNLVASFLVLISVGQFVRSFPKGAPAHLCIDLIPHHGFQQQLTNPDYVITTSKLSYNPNENITVTLTATGSYFIGFTLKAQRVSGDWERPLGKFEAIPSIAKGRTYYPEGGWAAGPNCVTHSSNAKKTEVKFEWTAPAQSAGDIIFKAAVVKDFNEFWGNVTSNTITASQAAAAPNPAWPIISSTMKNIDVSTKCGKTHGCVLYPQWCHHISQCQYFLTFKDDGDSVIFEMGGVSNGYMALGFSTDKIMGKDQTIVCTVNNGVFGIQKGYNPAYHTSRQLLVEANLTDVDVVKNGEMLYCKFRRPNLVESITSADGTEKSKYDISKNPYYVFLASGRTYLGADVVWKHTLLPVVSDEQVNFIKNDIVHSHALPLLVRIHGSLSVAAWLLLAGLGMITARFFKKVFDKQLKGVKMWFWVHRIMMSFVFLLAIAAITIIIVYLEGWNDEVEFVMIHGIVGISAVGLAVFQVIGGLARPDVHHRFRFIFNIFHAIVGNLIFLAACGAMIITFFIEFMPIYLRYIIVAGAGLSYLLYLISWICFQCCKGKTKKIKQPAEKYEMSGIQHGSSTNPMMEDEYDYEEPPNRCRNGCGYFFYVLSLVLISGFVMLAINVF